MFDGPPQFDLDPAERRAPVEAPADAGAQVLVVDLDADLRPDIVLRRFVLGE